MRLRLAVLLVLASCATTRAAEDEDDRRLGRDADRAREERPPAEADEEERKPKARDPAMKKSDGSAALAAAAMASAQNVQNAQARGESECRPLETKEVTAEEARTLGSAMALGFARSGKGLYLDGVETTPAALSLQGFPKGPKSDVTSYVQSVGARIAKGTPMSFGVVENDEVGTYSTMGGWVLVTTGMLALTENEAQLAGVLAREASLVSTRVHEGEYRKARHSACRIALTGLYLVEAGGTSMPGGEEFIRNSRYAKTMKALSSTGQLDPEADAEFVSWFINRTLDMQKLTGLPRETSDAADKGAVELMAAAGYDPGEYSKLLAKLPPSYSLLTHAPANHDRQELVDKARQGKGKGGKAPAFPKQLSWPRRQ